MASAVREAIERNGILSLRLSLAIVFLWFGALKFFPQASPAEDIAVDTVGFLTFGLLSPKMSLVLLGALECGIGLGMLFHKMSRIAVPLLYFQMACTLLPLVAFPEKTWDGFLAPTLLGQYILKNVVIIACAIVLGAIARGGHLVTDPKVARQAKKKEEEKIQNSVP